LRVSRGGLCFDREDRGLWPISDHVIDPSDSLRLGAHNMGQITLAAIVGNDVKRGDHRPIPASLPVNSVQAANHGPS
jgi:hypothetical protein